MHVINTCKYEKDRMKKAEKTWQHRCLDAQEQVTLWSVGGSGYISDTSKLSCISLLPASMKRIGSKTAEKKWQHRFPHYHPMGAISCYRNQCFDPIWPKTVCSLSPSLIMLQIKFDCDRPAGH